MDLSMREETITLRKLTASDGCVLTNGEVYGKEIYLGKHDSSVYWQEISEERYAQILKKEEEDNV